MRLTKAQRREWDFLRSGKDADGQLLERAGLIEVFTEITLVRNKLTKVERWQLTPAGRAALDAEGER